MFRAYTLLCCIFVLTLSGCYITEPSNTIDNEVTVSPTQIPGGTIPQNIQNINILGEPFRETNTQTITTNNCDGLSPTTQVARSLSTEQITTFDVQASAGSIIKGAAIPQILESQLEAEIRAGIRKDYGQSYQQDISVDLLTDPGTANEHTITWNDVKINGSMEVVFLDAVAELLFQRTIGLELANRTSTPLVGICDNIIIPFAQQTLTKISPPSSTSTPVVVEVTYPQLFFTEETIPEDTFMTITVNDGEIHAMTSGTICVAAVCLPGGTDRGSVVVFLPKATYHVTGLIPRWNWHGAYHARTEQWEIIATQLSGEQKIPGTCSDGDGCSVVDVVVIGPNGIVAQYQD
jgi:hypothetical protein